DAGPERAGLRAVAGRGAEIAGLRMTLVGRAFQARRDVSRTRQRRHLYSRIVEARTAPEIGERIGDERRAARVVPRIAAPDALRQADRAAADRRCDVQRAVHFTEIVEHP